MKKRRPRPRTDVPDWRDPNMPVLAAHKTRGLVPVTPEFAQGMAAHKLARETGPDWRNDDTYRPEAEAAMKCCSDSRLIVKTHSEKLRIINPPWLLMVAAFTRRAESSITSIQKAS